MPARDLMIVGLRVVGIWLIVAGFENLVQLVSTLITFAGQFGATRDLWSWSVVLVAAVAVVKLALAVGLVVFARPIGLWFYPEETEKVSELSLSKVGAGDFYRIACFMMGIYMLIVVVQSGARLTASAIHSSSFWNEPQISADIIRVAVFLPVTVVLIFGSRGVANLLAGAGHDPDAVPNPQFTIRVIILVMLAAGFLLGLLRYLAHQN